MFKSSSVVEQLAAYLSEQIKEGRWSDVLPGRNALAKELNINGSTLERALGLLEREGLLESQGVGKRRRIKQSEVLATRQLRVLIVLYDRDDEVSHHILNLQHQLHAAGHDVMIAPKNLMELKHEPERVAELVQAHNPGACIVLAASRPILERVSVLLPTFAFFGAMTDLPLAGAGPNKIPAMREAIRWLHGNGLKRIVMLSREEQLRGKLRPLEAAYLDELENLNLSLGAYNLPIWSNTPDGFNRCLDSLFKVTPPDAILVDEITLYGILQHYLVHKRGAEHRRVIRICMEYHPIFEWYRPSVPHLYWNSSKIVQRIVRWVSHVAKGQEDVKQTRYSAKFVEGGALAALERQ
jgi:DNA-binding LacI/PurR family transcriptional regulator